MSIDEKIKRLGGKTAAAASIGLSYLAFQARYRRNPDKLSELLDAAVPVVKFVGPGFGGAVREAYAKAGGVLAFVRGARPGADDELAKAVASRLWRLSRHGAKFDTRPERWSEVTRAAVESLANAGVDINGHLTTSTLWKD